MVYLIVHFYHAHVSFCTSLYEFNNVTIKGVDNRVTLQIFATCERYIAPVSRFLEMTTNLSMCFFMDYRKVVLLAYQTRLVA